MPTIVRHVNDVRGYDIYIGRAHPRRGLKASKWANPFPIGPNCTREQSLAMYRQHLYQPRPGIVAPLINDIHEVRGVVCGCWCKAWLDKDGRWHGHDEDCHGDSLAELANQLEEGN